MFKKMVGHLKFALLNISLPRSPLSLIPRTVTIPLTSFLAQTSWLQSCVLVHLGEGEIQPAAALGQLMG